MPGFQHLRVHSDFSIHDSLVRVDDYVTALKASGYTSAALTDSSVVFGFVRLQKAAHEAGLKSIAGADITVDIGDGRTGVLPILCRNQDGYQSLSRLLTMGYEKYQKADGSVVFPLAALRGNTEGLVALSGAMDGQVGKLLSGNNVDAAKLAIEEMREIFGGHFYIEVQRIGRDGEAAYLQSAVALSAETGVPLVATNDVRFLTPEEFDSHSLRVAIQRGVILDSAETFGYTQEQYLKSPQEMVELFADLPEAIENAGLLADMCTFSMEMGKVQLPKVATGLKTDKDMLAEMARAGLEKRLSSIQYSIEKDEYRKRLEWELGTIDKMGFNSYFLVVSDFCQWSKKNDIPVGPGRGSGAGSMAAWALEITELDPIRHGLLFERFLNPERVSMPDFDIDFCINGRDRVIEYVRNKYGHDHVVQIATHATEAARGVIKDVGRALGHSYNRMDRFAKTIPDVVDITLPDALKDEAVIAAINDDPEIKVVVDKALPLEGIVCGVGRHAAGVIISPKVITDYAPIYREPGSEHYAIQYDMGDSESIGLIKFDFLGLRNLTVIKAAVDEIKEQFGYSLDINNLPENDPKTFQLLQNMDTSGVFQLESEGMRNLLKRLQPESFEDIVSLVALFRPGPLQSGMVDDFIERKHGRQEVNYMFPEIEGILKPTYGVIVYQEQVMQIAQALSGYTLGRADILRRAMGKKKPEVMAKERAGFVDGAVARGQDGEKAGELFDLIEKFAGYGFNKSHSAAYAMLAYQTAYLKAHFPEIFLSAVINSEIDNTDKVSFFVQDAKRRKINVLPPHVNAAQARFGAEEKTMVYGLMAIKGIGANVATAIASEVVAGGRFTNLADFLSRMSADGAQSSVINKRVIESLANAGALDSLGFDRGQIARSATQLVKMVNKFNESKTGSLFGDDSDVLRQQIAEHLSEVEPYDIQTRWEAEMSVLGNTFSEHPCNTLQDQLGFRQTIKDSLKVDERRKQTSGRIVVRVDDVIHRATSRGPILVIKTSDASGVGEFVIWEPSEYPTKPTEGQYVVIDYSSKFNPRFDKPSVSVNALVPVSEYNAAPASYVSEDEQESADIDALASQMNRKPAVKSERAQQSAPVQSAPVIETPVTQAPVSLAVDNDDFDLQL